MLVGVPREVKVEEYRVALTPAGAFELSRAGHDVVVEQGAGSGAGRSAVRNDRGALKRGHDVMRRPRTLAGALEQHPPFERA